MMAGRNGAVGGRVLALGLLGALAGAAACGGGDDVASADARAVEGGTSVPLFGDDRVADKLAANPDLAPADYPAVEELFKIGRKCARADSHEVYIVEENNTRFGSEAQPTDRLVPRAVITGCNTDLQGATSAFNSFGLMVALISADDGSADPMVLTPVETMAYDRTTGQFNFYVFSPADGGGAVVERLVRTADDRVLSITKEPGKPAREEESSSRRCFGCHVNGAPLMNEIREPWTNWVSTQKRLPETHFEGETASIVGEAARPNSTMVSFANDLEVTIRAGIGAHVDGVAAIGAKGWGKAVLAGEQPGGVARLLRSAFCETELNYASGVQTIPIELFAEPEALVGLETPGTPADDVFPRLLPVRSAADKRLELFLLRQRVLSLNTKVALRVIDDKNDVFSPARCSLFDAVAPGLPADAAQVDAHVATVLRSKLADGTIAAEGARRAYLETLLTPGATGEAVKAAKAPYEAEGRAAFAADARLLETPEGVAALKAREQARKDAAKAMFNNGGPLPVL